MKEFTSIQKATVKRTRQNVDSSFEKLAKINDKLAKLQKEKAEFESMIEMMELPILHMTGYRSTDLCIKTKDDKTGQARFVLLYPETLIPVVEETEHIEETITDELYEETELDELKQEEYSNN
jgi:transcriptional regulator of heat shock response